MKPQPITFFSTLRKESNTMNQSELITKVASISGESRKAVEAVLKTAGDVIGSTLGEGGEVTLPGIGKLSVTHTTARTGRNPKTGEAIEIPAKKKPHFSAAKALKDATSS
jgi:DNA-binding protein HU-beta